MRTLLIRTFALIAATYLVLACTKVPIIGRRQLNLIPDAIMLPIGVSAYQSTLAGLKVAQRGEQHATVQDVGERIARVAGSQRYDWEFALVKDADTVNAWALPGGKVAVYSGILPVCENEAGLAFIMGHEVGHVVARHGSERLSQQLAVLGGLAGLYLYLDNKTELSEEQQAIILATVGLGSEVGLVLPFSRKHEREADVIGMMYMAGAGYPPDQAIEIWDRMEQSEGGSAVPAFLSTHPSYDDRQENLQEWLPQAKRRYQRNKLDRDTTGALWQ
jgi:predicted Zn-dependent protease